jgi:hypothetical protein
MYKPSNLIVLRLRVSSSCVHLGKTKVFRALSGMMWSRGDWFTALMGFEERDYDSTKANLDVLDDPQRHGCKLLRSRVTGKTWGAGELELVSLQTLRERVADSGGLPGRLKVSCIVREARQMHQDPEFKHALIQVASQFNLLEMVGPSVCPEDGVTRYSMDRTQGPACAIAAGAGTIYRNYCVPVLGENASVQLGQTRARQLDGISGVGALLAQRLGCPLNTLWSMRNGYCMLKESGLVSISELLARSSAEEHDALRARLCIGVHSHVQVTDGATAESAPTYVSQAYCSALPVSYYGHGKALSASFATLVLEGLYEATLLAAILNAKRDGSNIVLLTCVGGGVFGNADSWIESAMRRAFLTVADQALDVRIVSYGNPDKWLVDMVVDLSSKQT